MTADLPGQPDGITDDSRDLPNPVNAAERVRNYISAFGDGLYDVFGGAPLYGRDLEALTRAVLNVAALTEDSDGNQLDADSDLPVGVFVQALYDVRRVAR